MAVDNSLLPLEALINDDVRKGLSQHIKLISPVGDVINSVPGVAEAH